MTEQIKTIDIGSFNGYPASELSNFAAHHFVVGTEECASAEGFLQSLKFSDIGKQREVRRLIGREAKRAGKNVAWYVDQNLYWCDYQIPRSSVNYQKLLDEAYAMLFLNDGFRWALLSTGRAVLTHSIGKTDPTRTVLTVDEFCGRLMRMRDSVLLRKIK